MEKTYINIQTREVLDMETVEGLKDNALLKHIPELYVEWNFKRNDSIDLDIYKVTKGANIKVWWIDKYGHEWEAVINSRSNQKSGCPYCTNQRTLIGYNNIHHTNKFMSSALVNKNDGDIYTEGSNRKVEFKCPDCGKNLGFKKISDVLHYGLSCNRCSDGVRFPEKVMINILDSLGIEYKHDIRLYKTYNKRYDFYIPSLNMIIETHGGHHMTKGFETLGGNTLSSVIENDKFKEQLAKENGIEHYIVIDCKHSDINYMKNNILNSTLIEILDLSKIDWQEIATESAKSIKKKCLDMYLSGRRDYESMAKELNIAYGSVMRYLNSWSAIGKCDYKTLDDRLKVYQLDLDYNLIKIWNTKGEVRKKYSAVYEVLKGKRNNIDGFIFMDENTYLNYLKDPSSYTVPLDVPSKAKRVVIQLDLSGNFIREWKSIRDAQKYVGLKSESSISNVCRGVKPTAKGFRWMYKEDYDNLIKSK